MTDKKERLVEIIEKEPELLKILNSKEHIQVLLEINKKPQKHQELKVNIYFKNVSILYNILDTLVQNTLIKKIEIDDESTYYLTEKGEEFVQVYQIAKEKFNLNGGE
jgi:DNA-binding HxlR family transcriptional regulator